MFLDAWRGFDGMFGGYVVARLAERAQCVEGFDLLSLAVEFTGSVRPGSADLQVDPRHRGTRTASVEVSVRQGHQRASAVAKLAKVSASHRDRPDLDMGELPAVGELTVHAPVYGDLPYTQFTELRMISHERVRGQPTTQAWVRLDETAAEVAALDRAGMAAVLIDAVPPSLFFAQPAPAYVPTIDFGLHLRPRSSFPEDGWFYAVASTVWATDDFCMEDTSLYTSTGAMVGQARQNRRIIWPGDRSLTKTEETT